MYKDNDSIPQMFEFNKDNWPINPATGEAYHRDEIVTNETIPYPRHVDPANPGPYWARRTSAQLAQEKARAAKKSKERQRRRANHSRTIKHTATDYLSGAEIQTREQARATVDLVERANGEPESPTNQLQFVVRDGPHYNPATGDWTVIVDGDEAAWADSKAQADRSYHELVDDSDVILVTVGGRLLILEM